MEVSEEVKLLADKLSSLVEFTSDVIDDLKSSKKLLRDLVRNRLSSDKLERLCDILYYDLAEPYTEGYELKSIYHGDIFDVVPLIRFIPPPRMGTVMRSVYISDCDLMLYQVYCTHAFDCAVDVWLKKKHIIDYLETTIPHLIYILASFDGEVLFDVDKLLKFDVIRTLYDVFSSIKFKRIDVYYRMFSKYKDRHLSSNEVRYLSSIIKGVPVTEPVVIEYYYLDKTRTYGKSLAVGVGVTNKFTPQVYVILKEVGEEVGMLSRVEVKLFDLVNLLDYTTSSMMHMMASYSKALSVIGEKR